MVEGVAHLECTTHCLECTAHCPQCTTHCLEYTRQCLDCTTHCMECKMHCMECTTHSLECTRRWWGVNDTLTRPVEVATRRFSIWEQLLRRNMKQFRGGLVVKAHRLVCHSTLDSIVIKTKKKRKLRVEATGLDQE